MMLVSCVYHVCIIFVLCLHRVEFVMRLYVVCAFCFRCSKRIPLWWGGVVFNGVIDYVVCTVSPCRGSLSKRMDCAFGGILVGNIVHYANALLADQAPTYNTSVVGSQ